MLIHARSPARAAPTTPIKEPGAGSKISMERATSSEPRRVALVHDFLVSMRGADRVFLEMCELWPDADVFSPVYDEDGTEGRFAHRNVHTSFLQKLHPSRRTFRALLPLYPAAIESFDLSGYDVVVSSSSAWAHAVLCDEHAVHVSYCHNPFRYAWNERHRTVAERDPVTRALLRGFFRRWREWDWIAAQRVDRYVTNSRTTQARIKTYFGRDSAIVYPPVQVDRFKRAEPGDHYLVLSELVSHKRIDTAVQAFAQLGLPLVIVGDGPDRRRLRRIAPPNVRFAGRVSDAEAARLLATCRAFLVTGIEEFGIAAVEAQASGRPVIARRGGGVLETVEEGVTGTFFEGGPDALADTVQAFDTAAIDPRDCVESANRFASSVFRRELPAEVERAVADSSSDASDRDRDQRVLARRRGGGRLLRAVAPR
jgi:glycosyltransferase involved in cell wall biosynthesis